MYKVLLADDEAIICNGIKGCIDWAAIDMEIVATASDGAEALEKIEAFCPDLCLLDVRMPFVDGLEVAKEYLTSKPDGIVILITGYDEFSYAKTAITTGVFGYILKPVDEEELLATVKKAAASLNDKRQRSDRQLQTDVLLENNLDALKQAFFKDWLSDKLSPVQVKNNLELHNICPSEQWAMLFVRFHRENLDEFLSEQALLEYANQMEQHLAHLLGDFSPFFLIHKDEKTIAAIHALDKGNLWIDLPARLYELFEANGMQAYIVHRVLEDMGELPKIYRESGEELKKMRHLSPIIHLLKQYIDQNYKNPAVRLQTFAQAHHTTSSYLSRLFKQELKQSFVDYLTLFRINQSVYYLKNPHIKICAIAEHVGYSSQHYYCESFKRTMGMSPSDYRKKFLLIEDL